MEKPIYLKKIDKDGYFCINEDTRETKYLTREDICNTCSEQVIKIITKGAKFYNCICEEECLNNN